MSIVTTDMVKEMAASLSRITASPQFLELIQQVQDAPESEALQIARRLSTLDNVTSMGIAVPDDLRITTRQFEAPDEAPSPGTPVSFDMPIVSFEDGCGTVTYKNLVITVRKGSE